MKDNNEHIPSYAAGGKTSLPLYDFYEELMRKNFLVTPLQISDANRIIEQYSGTVEDEQELCNFLVPVFATSHEEQVQFRNIFENFFKDREIEAGDKITVDKVKDGQKEHFKKNWWKYLLIVVTLIIVFVASEYRRTATVCPSPNFVDITKSVEGDSVKIGEPITLNVFITGEEPDSIKWTNQEVRRDLAKIVNKKEVTISFKNKGKQTVTVTAFYGGKTSPCNVNSQISFIVYDATTNATSVVLAEWFYWLGLVIVLILLILFLAIRRHRIKKKKDYEGKQIAEEYQELTEAFSSNSGSANVPFQNKDYLPLLEPELSVVARMMRLRVKDKAFYMDIEKTIAKTILNNGFFEPVISARTQQSEFLALIDQNRANNLMARLFSYLTDQLKAQRVYIDKFYYITEPRHCYIGNEAKQINLEKLSEKFPDHTLLIFGNAYQLINQHYPVIDQDYDKLLDRWQERAVITPVPFLDWGNKEKEVLLEELSVFPADIAGLLLLMRKHLGEENNILSELRQASTDFYETDLVDFEDIDELLEYCAKARWANISDKSRYSNVLFQWLAALTIYPKINWEITISIGKAILDKYGLSHELNFSNLLRLARITWMQTGQFPDYTRLSLLKKLSVENEIIARETILSLFLEISDSELNGNHFAFEEKETQRLVNEFNLFAYDPIKYPLYGKSKNLFARLYQNNLLIDTVTKTYLDNNGLQWKTLINHPTRDEGESGKRNISLSEYLSADSKRKNWLMKLYKPDAGFRWLTFVFILGIMMISSSFVMMYMPDEQLIRIFFYINLAITTFTTLRLLRFAGKTNSKGLAFIFILAVMMLCSSFVMIYMRDKQVIRIFFYGSVIVSALTVLRLLIIANKPNIKRLTFVFILGIMMMCSSWLMIFMGEKQFMRIFFYGTLVITTFTVLRLLRLSNKANINRLAFVLIVGMMMFSSSLLVIYLREKQLIRILFYTALATGVLILGVTAKDILALSVRNQNLSRVYVGWSERVRAFTILRFFAGNDKRKINRIAFVFVIGVLMICSSMLMIYMGDMQFMRTLFYASLAIGIITTIMLSIFNNKETLNLISFVLLIGVMMICSSMLMIYMQDRQLIRVIFYSTLLATVGTEFWLMRFVMLGAGVSRLALMLMTGIMMLSSCVLLIYMRDLLVIRAYFYTSVSMLLFAVAVVLSLKVKNPFKIFRMRR